MVARGPESEERRGCGAPACDGESRGTRPGWRAPCQSSSSSRPAGRSVAGTGRVPGLRTPRRLRRASRAVRLPHHCRCRGLGSASRRRDSLDNAGARSSSPSRRRTAARRRRRRSPSRSLDSGWACRRTPYPVPPVRTPGPGLGRIACSPAWAFIERATGCRGRADWPGVFSAGLYTRIPQVHRPCQTPAGMVASRPGPRPPGSWCRSGYWTCGTAVGPRRSARSGAWQLWP